MNVKIMLVSESGEILDSTDFMSAEEFNAARTMPMGAVSVLSELTKVQE